MSVDCSVTNRAAIHTPAPKPLRTSRESRQKDCKTRGLEATAKTFLLDMTGVLNLRTLSGMELVGVHEPPIPS